MTGLTPDEVKRSRAEHGSNQLPETRGRSWLAFLMDALRDRTLRILLVCAGLAFGASMASGHVGTDGIGILLAVIVASSVSATNEYRAQVAFEQLQRAGDASRVRVLRDGEVRTLSGRAVVVGDVLELEAGAKVPADARVVEAVDLEVDESLLTGESEPVALAVDGEVRAGTVVTDGRARVVVTAVGTRTEYGRLRAELSFDREPTPLQIRLAAFADRIGIGGSAAAALIFVALVGDGIARGQIGFGVDALAPLLSIVTLAVTIVVVAVPEGLPVAVTLALAYGVRRMAADGTLVRRLVATETMGGVDMLLVDKTGTLTMNRMEVVGASITNAERFARVVAIDSTAHLRETERGLRGVGSPTETALLADLQARGFDWKGLRRDAEVVGIAAFSSNRKWMATRVRAGEGDEILIKGAPDVLLPRCTRIEREGEGIVPLSDEERDTIGAQLQAWTDQGARTLLIGFRPVPTDFSGDWSEEIVLVGVVAIADPVRPGVEASIQRCREAGVEVIMVTGDHLRTGIAVAERIGLLGPEDRAVDAASLRALDDEALAAELSEIRVVGRAVPADKMRLVEVLRDRGHVVAVTGDGTNDGPALRHADVGLSMGRSGTDVAREASDIVLVNDDFTSVVRAIRWGRAIHTNLQRFVQFQLTVSMVALVTAFVAGATGRGTPLTAAEMLWVNLIMDALAALALAMERPDDRVSAGRPYRRSDPLVSGPMVAQVAILGAAMLVVLGALLYTDLGLPQSHAAKATLVFNTFVFLQIGNLFNARATRFDTAPSAGLTHAPAFFGIVALIVAMQVVIVQFGGPLFGTVPIGPIPWLIGLCAVPYMLVCGALLRAVGRRRAQWEPHVAPVLRAVLALRGSKLPPEAVAAGGGLAIAAGFALRALAPGAAGVAFALFALGSVAVVRFWLGSATGAPNVRSERLHTMASIALALVLFGQINYVASRHYTRLDWTQARRFALSPQSDVVLAGISRPVTLTRVLRPGRIQADIDGLLLEYEARGKAVEVRGIDPDASPGELERLAERAGLKSAPTSGVLVELDGRSRVLALEDLFERTYVYKGGRRYLDKSQPPLFRGEQAITSALVALSRAERPMVCFARGHGERDADSFEANGLALFRDRLLRDGFAVRKVQLVEGAAVPDDCLVLASVGPTIALSGADRRAIGNYLGRGGKWLLTIEPFVELGLEPLLREWGVEVRRMYVTDPDATVAGADTTTLLAASYPSHPITAGLGGIPVVFPYVSAVRRAEAERRLGGANLVITGPKGIGETDPRSSVPRFDPGIDRKGEISVAAAVDEPQDLYAADGRKEPARLVVVGDSGFVTNAQITRMGNGDFATNAVDWLARREELIAVRGRPPEDRRITLSSEAQRLAWWLALGLIPGSVALVGGAVAWRRRS